MSVVLKPTPRSVIAVREKATRAKPLVITSARTVAIAPVHMPTATGRGLKRLAIRYYRWVREENFMESSRTAGTWHKDAQHHRARVLQNFKMSLIMLVVLIGGVLAFWFLTPGYVQAMIVGVFALYLNVLGWRKSEGTKNKARKVPGLLGITNDQLNDVFLKAGVHKKDDEVEIIKWPHRDGRGVALTVDMAPGRTAAEAIKARSSIASWLHLQETGLVLTRVRGSDGHSGRLSMWAMPGDPFEAGSGEHPLLGEQSWNAWRGAPLGMDARGREVSIKLVGSHMLVGAAPNAGKSFAGRCIAAPFILDPGARLFIADGKGSDTWAAAARCADAYISDALDPDAAALRVSRMLDAITAELRQRNATKIQGSKLTETRSRDAADPVPLLLIVIDEMQEFTSNTSPDPDSADKKMTLGKSISTKLMQIGKLYRSAGAILLLLTQRPDDDALPKGLRAVLMTRFALRVRDRFNSDMILGPEMASRGYCTAEDEDGNGLLSGVGILIPDPGADPDAAKGYPTVRTFEVDEDNWAALCTRGAALRNRDAEDDGEGFNPPARVELPTPVPTPVQAIVEPPSNVVVLRDYLLSEKGSGFRTTHELCKALGIDPRELRQLMDQLGCPSKVGDVYDKVAGRKRQARGYNTDGLLQKIADAA